MKRIALFALLLITALLLGGCTNHGNVNHVLKTVGESEVYTEDEIRDAMDIVINHFRREFEGCTLIQLYFDEDTPDQYSPSRAQQYNADEAIILISSFETGPESAGMGLNDNDTYNGFSWILTRSKGGSWTLQSWGYG